MGGQSKSSHFSTFVLEKHHFSQDMLSNLVLMKQFSGLSISPTFQKFSFNKGMAVNGTCHCLGHLCFTNTSLYMLYVIVRSERQIITELII
jgi:hypothetical protein